MKEALPFPSHSGKAQRQAFHRQRRTGFTDRHSPMQPIQEDRFRRRPRETAGCPRTAGPRYGDTPPEKADVIVALGGDGYMLQTLHQHMTIQKPIYGMNQGTLGFLMNEYRE